MPLDAGSAGWHATAYAEPWSGLMRASGEWSIAQVPQVAHPGAAFDALLRALRPAAAVLSVGRASDEALSALLREHGVPHVVAHCNARATAFEAVVIDAAPGACLRCLRDPAFVGAGHDPGATVLAVGRAADVVARLAGQLSRPVAARAGWFRAWRAGGGYVVRGYNPATHPFVVAEPGAGADFLPGEVRAQNGRASGCTCSG